MLGPPSNQIMIVGVLGPFNRIDIPYYRQLGVYRSSKITGSATFKHARVSQTIGCALISS